jgi:cytochrome c oxidase cbb3-type subunit 4
MTYQIVVDLAVNSGLLYFIGLTAVVLVYVLWPSNRAKFERAARLPLETDEG